MNSYWLIDLRGQVTVSKTVGTVSVWFSFVWSYLQQNVSSVLVSQPWQPGCIPSFSLLTAALASSQLCHCLDSPLSLIPLCWLDHGSHTTHRISSWSAQLSDLGGINCRSNSSLLCSQWNHQRPPVSLALLLIIFPYCTCLLQTCFFQVGLWLLREFYMFQAWMLPSGMVAHGAEELLKTKTVLSNGWWSVVWYSSWLLTVSRHLNVTETGTQN